jgi:hypothetical protein
VQSQHRAWNPHRGDRDDCEGCNLSPEGPGPKACESTVCNARFPKRFQAPSNIIKYDDKTNLSIWLEDYCLTCKVGGADDDFFII